MYLKDDSLFDTDLTFHNLHIKYRSTSVSKVTKVTHVSFYR